MEHIVALCIFVLVGLLMAINAVFMLASPKSWFRLPSWLRAQGSLTEEKYATGWGAEVRLTGAIILSGIIWVLYDLLRRG